MYNINELDDNAIQIHMNAIDNIDINNRLFILKYFKILNILKEDREKVNIIIIIKILIVDPSCLNTFNRIICHVNINIQIGTIIKIFNIAIFQKPL